MGITFSYKSHKAFYNIDQKSSTLLWSINFFIATLASQLSVYSMLQIKGLVLTLNIKIRLLLVLISILLLYLSMPGSPFPLLTWVALVPAGLAIINASVKLSGALLYLSAIGWWFVGMCWLIPALEQFTHLNTFIAFLILLIFCLVLAVPYALIGCLVAYKNWLNKPFGVLYISACYTVIVSFFPTMLPVNHAHSLYQYPTFLQLLDLGGVAIVLFVVVFVNWQFVKAITIFKKSPRGSCYAVLTGGSTLVLVLLYGAWQINRYNQELQTHGKSIKIGIVQPNLHREDALDNLYVMSARLVAENPSIDLLVWPEFPAEFSYVENQTDKKRVDQLISIIKKPILLVSGYIYETPPTSDQPEPHYYNTAQLIDQNHQLKGSYKKQVLVPFFEYLPAEQKFPLLRELFPGTLLYIPGDQVDVLPLSDNTRIIPLICYETVFPDLTRSFIEQGGNIIINLTNDIWFGDSWGSSYHFAVGLFRSIEHRVPWVRATNSGISGVAKATGEIIEGSTTPLLKTATRIIKVKIPPERSFYSRYGDVFLYSLTLILLVALFRPEKSIRRLGRLIDLPS